MVSARQSTRPRRAQAKPKKAQNKQRFPKGKKTLSFDGSNKMNNEKPRFKGAVKGASDTKKSSGGYSFKNPFSKFVLPAVSNAKHGNAVGTQDSMAFASGKDFEEERAVQKVVANDSNMPISLSAIG